MPSHLMHRLRPLTPAERTMPRPPWAYGRGRLPACSSAFVRKGAFFFCQQRKKTATVTLQAWTSHSQCTLMVVALSMGTGTARLLAWHSSGLPLSELKAVNLRRRNRDKRKREERRGIRKNEREEREFIRVIKREVKLQIARCQQ